MCFGPKKVKLPEAETAGCRHGLLSISGPGAGGCLLPIPGNCVPMEGQRAALAAYSYPFQLLQGWIGCAEGFLFFLKFFF